MKKYISFLLVLSMLMSMTLGFPTEAKAQGEQPITAEALQTYEVSEDAQDIVIRINVSGLTADYTAFVIDGGIELPEGFVLKSYSSSDSTPALTTAHYNTENGKLNYFNKDTYEAEIAPNTYYEAVVTAPAQASGDFTVKFKTVQVADTYGSNILIEQDEVVAEFSIDFPAPPATEPPKPTDPPASEPTEPGETAPYEVYYVLKNAAGNVVADDDNDDLSKFGVGDTVTAEFFMVSNNGTITLQAYDIFLSYADELVFQSENMAGVAYAAGADVSTPAVTGDKITHIVLVDSKNHAYTLTEGQAVPLGTVTFTIDAENAVYGEAMNIELIQAEDTSANAGKQENVTNFSVGSASTGDKKSYYPAVTGDVVGAEVDTQYTITWANDDGTEVATTTVGHGLMPQYDGETPTKEADAQYTYTFDHWTPAVQEAMSDTTYKAVYATTVNSYTVIWQNWDGAVLETDTVEYGKTPVFDGETPTKAEDNTHTYVFDKWTPTVDKVTGDVTYTAAFTATAKSFKITFALDGGTLPAGVTNPMTYTCEDLTALPTPEREGYAFEGWSLNASVGGWDAGVYAATDKVTGKYGDVTLTALWRQVAFTVTFAPMENGTAGANPAGGEEGEIITLNLVPDAGYEVGTVTYQYVLEGVTTTETIEPAEGVYSFALPAANVKVTVTFVKAKLDVNVDAENIENGTVTATPDPAELGEEVALSNTPETGYILDAYTVTYTDAQGVEHTVEVTEDGTFVMPEYPVTVTASFRLIKYNVQLVANNGTEEFFDLDPVEYNADLKLIKNFFQKTGHKFLGWSLEPNATQATYVDESTVKNLSATEGAVVKLYAVWQADTYLVTLEPNGGTIVEGNVTKYTFGTETTLPTNVTKAGFVFGGWYANEDLSGDPVTAIGATETGNKDYYAKWNPQAAVAIEGYTYAAEGFVLVRITDNLAPNQEYRINGQAMYWTDDANYLVAEGDTGAFYLLVEEQYVDIAKGEITGELTIETITGDRQTITYDGDINGDGVVNITDANIIYQMVLNGGKYYSGDNDLTIEQRLKADMDKTVQANSDDHRCSTLDVNAIVNLINAKN